MKKDSSQKPASPPPSRNALIAEARRTDLLAINAAVRAGQDTVDREALFSALQELQHSTRALLRALEGQAGVPDAGKLDSVA